MSVLGISFFTIDSINSFTFSILEIYHYMFQIVCQSSGSKIIKGLLVFQLALIFDPNMLRPAKGIGDMFAGCFYWINRHW